MENLKLLYYRLSKTLKFSITNPNTFKQILSFKSNLIRVFSLLFIILLLTSLFSIFLVGGFDYFFSSDSLSINRNKLEEQGEKIAKLYSKIESQQSYITNIKSILNNEIQAQHNIDSLEEKRIEIDISKMHSKQTVPEKKNSEKVKQDMSTNLSIKNNSILYFGNPVKGIISQEFDSKNHYGIDVVTEKDQIVKSCLAGTIIYTGFTHKDGYIVIVKHLGGYISIYKHNKIVLKKIGTKVQLGDPISIIGNTGENTDGPHLHFELWHDQRPVNPIEYMSFK